ncbi:serine/threonine-protein phosphatase 2A regulatory subunit B' [Pancytospora epiphaga]|nr:serine/threonine-protein phosphatase 2A regulatory subunit B' [Pancytospora epiphaga]
MSSMVTKRGFENVTEIDPKLVKIISMIEGDVLIPEAFKALEYYISVHPDVDSHALCFIVNGISPFFNRLCIECQEYPHESIKLQFKSKDMFCPAIPESVYILRVVTLLLKGSSLPYSLFVEYFGGSFVPGLVSLLRSQDSQTRTLAFGILQKVGGQYKQLHSLFLEAAANEFTSLFIKVPAGLPEDVRTDNRSIEWVAKFLLIIFDSEVFLKEAETYYLQYILPAVLSTPPSFSPLILIFCREFPPCQTYTVRHFCKIYDKGTTSVHVWLIDMLAKVIEIHVNTGGNVNIEYYVSLLLAKALSSESFIVIDAALSLFLNVSVQNYLKDEITEILPKCFSQLYKLSKKFWRQEQRIKALEIVGGIIKFNREIFEACLIEYNSQKLGESDGQVSPTNQDEHI